MMALAVFVPDVVFPARQSSCLICHRPHQVCQANCVSCHRGDDRTGRKEIAHHDLVAGRFAHYRIEGSSVVKRGRELLERLSCRRCHVYAEKVNRLANSLDVTGVMGKARDIHGSIKNPVLFMPDFHLSDTQIALLVNAILATDKSAKRPGGEAPIVVHFQDSKKMRKNLFTENCGTCHKILSEQSGGLGSGDVAPNLSGLFSGFYPRTYLETEAWEPEKLKKWLDNPRDVRKNATMQPVRLPPGDFDKLLGIIHTARPTCLTPGGSF